ncbi:MAG: hypothetical protein ACRCUE_08305 [Bosea sp. (in: a-proteobacteria)]
MARSIRSLLVASAVAVAIVAVALPVQAAPWAKSGQIAVEPMTEEVNWRGRRNGALVAGAIGLGVLGIAAAAASQRRGYYGGGYEPDYGYGYAPTYGYAPSYGYAPRTSYEYEYVQPRQRYVEAPVYGHGPYYRGGGYGHHRDYGRGLNRSQRGRDAIETGGR